MLYAAYFKNDVPAKDKKYEDKLVEEVIQSLNSVHPRDILVYKVNGKEEAIEIGLILYNTSADYVEVFEDVDPYTFEPFGEDGEDTSIDFVVIRTDYAGKTLP